MAAPVLVVALLGRKGALWSQATQHCNFCPCQSHLEEFTLCSVAQSCLTLLRTHGLYSPLGSSVHGVTPGRNTGMGCHFLLQGIFLTQGLNWCLLRLLHLQTDSLPLHLMGSPSGDPLGMLQVLHLVQGHPTSKLYHLLQLNPYVRGLKAPRQGTLKHDYISSSQ